MNVPVGSRLVDDVSFRWLVPVRRVGSVIHYVARESVDKQVPGKSLCGEVAPCTERGTLRWRRVRGAPASKICATCHAKACASPTRIDWS